MATTAVFSTVAPATAWASASRDASLSPHHLNLKASPPPSTNLRCRHWRPRVSTASLPVFHEDEDADEPITLRDICNGRVPDHILQRSEEIGFITPTDVQRKSLPLMLSGRDCILHSQAKYLHRCIGRVEHQLLQLQLSGSGKTLAYLFVIFSVINFQRSAVQALIVVPTRELGMQVTKVARVLAAKPVESEMMQRTCTIMALLDGGILKRHKSWLKERSLLFSSYTGFQETSLMPMLRGIFASFPDALLNDTFLCSGNPCAEPPQVVVATMGCLAQMLEKHILNLEAMQVLVIDEVDFMFHSSNQVHSLRKLLTSYSTINTRQTIFASASVPQHNHFLYECIQQKWTKKDAVHIHVNPVQPMPFHLHHRYVICGKHQRLHNLLSILQADSPRSAIIFVNDQSERSKKAGELPSTTLVIEFLRSSYKEGLDICSLEKGMNFNVRATSLSEARQGCCLLVATDLVGRGVDLPETSHIYNFDIPRTAVDYLHRAGRTCRKPFSDENYVVTTLITEEERFVLQRYENELLFKCEEVRVFFPQ